MRRRRAWRAAPGWRRELLVVGALYLFYEAVRAVTHADFSTAMANGHAILDWERSWHLSPELALNNALGRATPLAVLASYLYATLHYAVTPAVLVWMYRRHATRYRFARTTLATSTILSLAVYYLTPTAPPRLLNHGGMTDVLASVHQWGWWGGDGSVPRGLAGLSNQFAAIPSLHVGWAVWCGALIAVFATRWYARALGALYPVVITLDVIATGNHYLLDAVAGTAVMAVGAGLTAALWWLRSRLRARTLADTGSVPALGSAGRPAVGRVVGPAGGRVVGPAGGRVVGPAGGRVVGPAGGRLTSAGGGITSRTNRHC